ncbi:MAG TPA: hypothetical protein VN151_12530 [Terracidiphilus sp.]|nr:hypothetical protein [Terracidiphilus sp.]
MNNETPREAFQAAYDRAAMELQQIQHEFERLVMRHQQVTRAVEVLKPESKLDDHRKSATMSLTTRMAGLAVRTRLTVMEKLPEE